MIKFFPIALVFVVFSCGESKTETKESTETIETRRQDSLKAAADKKTEISVGPDGAKVETKQGTEVKVNDKGVSIGTKDVNIKVGEKQ